MLLRLTVILFNPVKGHAAVSWRRVRSLSALVARAIWSLPSVTRLNIQQAGTFRGLSLR